MRFKFSRSLAVLLAVSLLSSRARGEPPVVHAPPSDAARQQGYHVYWGDLHGHSNVSDGDQNIETPKRETPEDYYRYGRDVAKLDFLALTDHAEMTSEAEWKHVQAVARQFDAPGRFVPMIGYEWTDSTKGHKVVLLPHLSGGPVYGAPSLRKEFKQQPGIERPRPFFIDYDRFFAAVRDSGGIVHAAHPSLGDCRTDWTYHDPQVQLNVEMAGTTGNPGGLAEAWYEDPSTPRQHPSQRGVTGCWVQDALARGYRLGFLGVNDTHSCEPGLKAKTGVWAKELSREALFDAIRQRRVCAVSRDRVAVWFEINGHPMGEEFRTGKPLRIELSATCDSPIARLEILKNNRVVWQKRTDGPSATLTADDQPTATTNWYYGRVVLANGHYAWSSPIWVQNPPKTPTARAPFQRDKYLLLDDRIVEHSQGTKLAVGRVKKSPANPLFVEDKPWEPRLDNAYANVIYDDEAKLYKCWYSPFVIDMMHQTTPRDRRKTTTYHAVSDELRKQGRWQREMGICYAYSQDGLKWTKPELDIRKWEGRPSNILLVGPHGAGIFEDLRETDASRRYKLFTGMTYAFSADGLHWPKPTGCPEVASVADTHNNAFWAPELGRYVGITRNWSGSQRTVARTESPDFVHWSKAVEVLRGTSPHQQPYALLVFRYADLYLGLLMMFNTKTDRVQCELAWSPDTIHWNRIDEGTPLIPCSETRGDYDWGTVYAAAYPVFLEKEIRLYYGAGNGPHTNWRDGSLALATLRPDGFAGIRSTQDDTPGTIVTQEVICTGKHLRIAADAQGGSIRVEVLDAAGLNLGQCVPMVTDVTAGPIHWAAQADLAAFVGKPIRLKFELCRATLYAFDFAP
jgi:hypothetical protein